MGSKENVFSVVMPCQTATKETCAKVCVDNNYILNSIVASKIPKPEPLFLGIPELSFAHASPS